MVLLPRDQGVEGGGGAAERRGFSTNKGGSIGGEVDEGCR